MPQSLANVVLHIMSSEGFSHGLNTDFPSAAYGRNQITEKPRIAQPGLRPEPIKAEITKQTKKRGPRMGTD